MEGKGVSRAGIIMGLLILGLVVGKTATAYRIICNTDLAKQMYGYCISQTSESIANCAKAAGCTITNGASSHPHSNMLQNSGAMISEYCKLGCASAVCDTLTTKKNSDIGEGEVNEAVELCVNVCSELCNSGAKTALASA